MNWKTIVLAAGGLLLQVIAMGLAGDGGDLKQLAAKGMNVIPLIWLSVGYLAAESNTKRNWREWEERVARTQKEVDEGWAAARVGTLLAVRLQEISAYEPKEDKDSKQRDELKYLQGLARDLDRMKRI